MTERPQTYELCALTDYERTLLEIARNVAQQNGIPITTLLTNNAGALIPNPKFEGAIELGQQAYLATYVKL